MFVCVQRFCTLPSKLITHLHQLGLATLTMGSGDTFINVVIFNPQPLFVVIRTGFFLFCGLFMSYCSWSGLSGPLSAYGHPAKLRGGDSVTLQPLSQGNTFERYLSTLTPETMRDVHTLLHCVCVCCVCGGVGANRFLNLKTYYRTSRWTSGNSITSMLDVPKDADPAHDR